MNYFESCNILNSNAILLAQHFQHRVEISTKEILIIRYGPSGKVKYCAIRVEFQFRGSLHIHSFLWVLNAPTLEENKINKYVEFLDSAVCGKLPSEFNHLDQLVKTFQTHCLSKTCRKYKNSKCCFEWRFFTDKTIIAIPLQRTLNQVDKFGILSKGISILVKLKSTLITTLIQIPEVFLMICQFRKFFLV